MKVNSIRQQVKKTDRYSVFVDGKYAFSLSEAGLLNSKLASGQELDKTELDKLKKTSGEDKLYYKALNYVARRSRSEWEVSFYLKRNQADEGAIDSILNKLRDIGLLNDTKYAKSFVSDRRTLRPASRRKITAELRKRHIANDIIEDALGEGNENEKQALEHIITSKRRQAKYQDNLKLMQYLARQGFSYADIKASLE